MISPVKPLGDNGIIWYIIIMNCAGSRPYWYPNGNWPDKIIIIIFEYRIDHILTPRKILAANQYRKLPNGKTLIEVKTDFRTGSSGRVVVRLPRRRESQENATAECASIMHTHIYII